MRAHYIKKKNKKKNTSHYHRQLGNRVPKEQKEKLLYLMNSLK